MTKGIDATIYMGPQKRVYNINELSDNELESVLVELRKYWNDNNPEYYFDVQVRCNLIESMNIYIECYWTNKNDGLYSHVIPKTLINELCDKFIRIEPKGEWLEKQNIYVKFMPSE